MGDELSCSTRFQLEDIPADIKDLRIQELTALLENDEILIGLRDSLAPVKARAEDYTNRAISNTELARTIEQMVTHQLELEKEITELKKKETESFAKWQQVESNMYVKSRPYTRLGIEELLRAKINDCEARKQDMMTKLVDSNTSKSEISGLIRVYADLLSDLHYYQIVLANT